MQIEMVRCSLERNSLVCLPTGSGKTLVSAAVMHAMLLTNPQKVSAFVVTTNHLVEQQSVMLQREMPVARIVTIFGQMDQEVRRTNLKVPVL